MLFDEALKYLLSLGHETLAIKLGLANTEALLEAVGRPQDAFRKVQIAGTNGKGSTAVMLDAVLRASGIETALFTSPHLISITERVRYNGQEISEYDFARLTTRVRDAALRLRETGALPALPTFFEHLTVMFLLGCTEARTELAVLETGLGGRLDATTAAGAEVVGITPIAIDHQEYLGDSLAEIAFEKAAIIRAGVEAVIAPQANEALEVIEKRCSEAGVTPNFVGDGIEMLGASDTGNFRATFETAEDRYEDVQLGLRGRHQVVNAALAIRLSELLRARGFSISREAIVEGIERAEHAGRLELWEGSPQVLFDGAHNRASAQALHDYLHEFVSAPATLIFGAMRDKELSEMAALLFPKARRLILTEMNNPRAATIEMLERIIPQVFSSSLITFAKSPADALRLAFEVTPADGLIAVTGSLYLVGEARALLLKRR
jgi:dihydrofolate synthase/folylpolyglutamate synthase